MASGLKQRRAKRGGSGCDAAQRAGRLLRHEIEFVSSPSFGKRGAAFEDSVLADLRRTALAAATGATPHGLPGHLARLCQAPLMSAEEEREAFSRMNYLKYRANVLRSRLDPQEPDESAVERCERLLQAAGQLRDRIIRANMRLVMAVVKKFVTPHHTFDDLLSNGTFSLMQAVDKFDCERGFRFSTYAYRAIARNTFRSIREQHRDAHRFVTGTDDAMFDAVDGRSVNLFREHAWDQLRAALTGMLSGLDRRELFILRSRYALGAHRKPRTFQYLADKLGISKERVRQLEQRAVAKLREMAGQLGRPELIQRALRPA